MNRKNWLIYSIVLLTGIGLGWALFGGSAQPQAAKTHNHQNSTNWTCSMHPSVEQPEPGQCPICGMELIKQGAQKASTSPVEFQMTEAARSLLNVQTSTVKKRQPTHHIRLNGTVEADEDRIQHQTAHFPGRIDKLYVSTTGEYVKDGDKLADLFSPELITAQQELFEAMKNRKTNPAMFEAAKEKLSLLKLPDEQIQRIIEQGKVQDAITFFADVNGYVLEKNVNYGDHVKPGTVMYEVADLSEVWVSFEAYGQEVNNLSVGDTIVFEVGGVPGKTFRAPITLIDPAINAQTRIAKVRVEVPNAKRNLKPGMFASGTAHAQTSKEQTIVPASAVMWTGPRSVVYTSAPDSIAANYQYHGVTLGANLGDHYIIKEGLKAGQEVITNANFMLDAEAQLQGKASMMNKNAADHEKMKHDHSEADKAMQTQDFKDQTPEALQAQLGNFIKPYLTIKDALVNGEASKASDAAGQALQALEKVDMKLLKGKAYMAWMERMKPMKDVLKAIQKHEEIKKQRDHFIPLSANTVKAVQAFGIKGADTLYIQHCPMTNDDKGADWISGEEKIRNPYYGEQMLTCGKVTETINNEH